MDIRLKKYVYITLLLLVLVYFLQKETGNLGSFLGMMLGTVGGGVVAVYPYLILRRLFLKMGFPSKVELLSFIIYTMIIISAVRSIPK